MVIWSDRFRRQHDRLPPSTQVAVIKILRKLQTQGSCRMKALSAYPGLYEIRVNASMRLILERHTTGHWYVRSVGNHGPILRRP